MSGVHYSGHLKNAIRLFPDLNLWIPIQKIRAFQLYDEPGRKVMLRLFTGGSGQGFIAFEGDNGCTRHSLLTIYERLMQRFAE